MVCCFNHRTRMVTSSSAILVCFLLFFLFGCFQDVDATTTYTLPAEEIEILKQIDSKLKVGWDFSVNPCSGLNGWIYKDNSTINSVVRNVTCGNCDANNNTCHVISILLKTQNLSGFLPPDFAGLKSLMQIDLTRNYLSGQIPVGWTSLPLLNISLGGNFISGQIPEEIGNIATLSSLVLENNLLSGPIPRSIGNLKNLTRLIISGNDFTGELPDSLGNLENLIDLRIDGSNICGKIPSFIGNWRKLVKLHMQGTSLEGPFPPTVSNLKVLSELRVSDLKGVGTFPPLQNTNLKRLILRNCSISGQIPAYIGYMSSLKVLDLSFNNFSGEIPSSYERLASNIKNMYINNNMLSGAIPSWILRSRQKIDVSFNYFDESTAPSHCEQQGSRLNVFSSSSSSENSLINPCLKRNFPCSGSATNYNLFINCGGEALTTTDGIEFDEDRAVTGASTFFLSYDKRWAFSSTGDFFGNSKANYIAYNSTMLKTMRNPELYMSARLSPSSLSYYGLCLQKGSYTVNLHFAEIMFVDEHENTFFSVGRRFFDVSIQGQKVLEDFNIVNAANGTGREVVMSFPAVVVDDGSNTLEIQFRWAGKGTSSIPHKGVYGPLVSAISITPNFKPDLGKERLSYSGTTVVGIAASSLAVLFFVAASLLSKRYPKGNEFEHTNLWPNRLCFAHEEKTTSGKFDPRHEIRQGGLHTAAKETSPMSNKWSRESSSVATSIGASTCEVVTTSNSGEDVDIPSLKQTRANSSELKHNIIEERIDTTTTSSRHSVFVNDDLISWDINDDGYLH